MHSSRSSSLRLFKGAVAVLGLALLATGASAATRLAIRLADAPRLSDILIEPAAASLAPGEHVQLTAVGLYEDGSTADITPQVLWSVRDDRVVTVSTSGLLTAIAAGSTDVDAEDSDSGRSASTSLRVTVASIDAVSIVPATATVAVGSAVQLTALADLSDGRSGVDVTEVVDWTSGKVAVATVSNTAGSKGVVTALQKGQVLIRAKDPDSGRQSPNDQGNVTVVEGSATPTPPPTSPTPTPKPTAAPEVSSIHLVPLQLKLLPGGSTGAIQAIATMSDGSQRDVSSEVEWKTSRDRVAVVGGTGLVTSGESGRADIDAHHPASGKDAEDLAEVWVGESTGITISPPGAQVGVGGTVQLSALRIYDNGLTSDVTKTVEWSSQKPQVATVSNSAGSKGRVSGVQKGDAVIVASDPVAEEQSDSDSGRITVVEGEPIPSPTPAGADLEIDKINLEPLDVSMIPGETITIHAMATLKDGTVVDVTDQMVYEVDDIRVASVTGPGRITAGESGKTKVDAYHPGTGKDVRSKAELWVGEVESIDISPSGAHFEVGDTIQLIALATYDNGLAGDLSATAEWSSEKTRVATVSNAKGSKGFVTGLSRGDAVIVARDPASGKSSKSSSGRVTVVEPGELDPGDVGDDLSYTIGLRQIVLDPQSLNLMPGETAFVVATGIYVDGSTRDLTEFVEFRSRRDRTASIDESGAVLGKEGGDTEIRVEEPRTGIQSRIPAHVHVAKMVSLDVWPPQPILAPGQTLQLLAFAGFDNGRTNVDVTEQVRWSSSRTSVAEVGREAPDWGLVTALALGETEITAQHVVSRVQSDRDAGLLRVTAEGAPTPSPTPAPTPTPEPGAPPQVVGERYKPATMALEEGQTGQIVTSLVLSDGSTVSVAAGSLQYETGDFRVARVDASGRVLASSAGSTTIRISDPVRGFHGDVTVLVRQVTGLVIKPASVALRVGGSVDLKAIASYSDGQTDVDVTSKAEWKSSNPLVASVDDRGRVTAVAPGSASIEVLDRVTRIRSDASTGVVTVVGNLVRVFLTPSRLALAVGEEKAFKAFGVFADGTTVQITDDVLWSIDAGLPPVATIDETGLVTAHAIGDAIVNATDLPTGISSADSGDSRELAVVGDLIGIKVSTSSDLNQVPDDVFLSAGETKSLKGIGQFVGRTDGFSLGSDLDWFSSNPGAVSVSGSGLVTCVTVGVATISAVDPATGIRSTDTLGDLPVTCSGHVVALRTSPDFRNLDYLATRQIRAYRMLEDGSEIEVTRKVFWTSSDPSIVSIVETGSDGGLATAVGDGEATLIAYDADFDVSSTESGQVSVIRTRKTRVLLEIFPEDDAVGFVGHVGQTYGFQARVTYASGATKGVNLLLTWESSDTSIALMGDGSETFKVNQAQLLAPGTVTITGTYPPDEASPDELSESVVFRVLP